MLSKKTSKSFNGIRRYAILSGVKNKTGKTILVTMPTINRPERLKLEGVLAYAHGKSGEKWQVELDFGALSGHPAELRKRKCDGIIAYVESPERRRELSRVGVPVVLIEDVLSDTKAPSRANVVTLLCDHASEGRAAAEYFLARHFSSFAWVGDEAGGDWGRGRRDGFVGRLKEAGCRVSESEGRSDELPGFLASLEEPCALFAIHDFKARQVLDAAAKAGIAVPRALAILGVDDDEMICTTVAPAISSIPTGDRSLGYAAGRALNELIIRRARGGRLIRVRRTRVISRLSTDMDALSDPFVACALQFARTNLAGKLDAASLARRVGYSRHMLQIRAEHALGHTLGEEIRRMRLAAAAELLSETDIPVAEIAESCGFTSTSHLSMRIKEAFGMTPLAYRRRQGKFTSVRFHASFPPAKCASISSNVLPFVSGRKNAAVMK